VIGGNIPINASDQLFSCGAAGNRTRACWSGTRRFRVAALQDIRQAAQKWNEPMKALSRGPGGEDEFDRVETLQVNLGNAFDELGSATRSLIAIAFKEPKPLI
jgi:hypothetical protein